MTDRYDLIIDFETMGQNATNCAVIECAVLMFNWGRFTSTPYTFDALVSSAKTFKLDVKSQVKDHGFVIDDDTLKFWGAQNKETQRRIAPSPLDLSLNEFVAQLTNYLIEMPKVGYWWSRNNTFDPIILWRIVDAVKGNRYAINEYLPHWRVRDTRTWIDAKFDFDIKNSFAPIPNEGEWKQMFEEHNPAHDIAADVLRLQTLARAEEGLEVMVA